MYLMSLLVPPTVLGVQFLPFEQISGGDHIRVIPVPPTPAAEEGGTCSCHHPDSLEKTEEAVSESGNNQETTHCICNHSGAYKLSSQSIVSVKGYVLLSFLQAFVRSTLARKHYNQLKRSTLFIQRTWRSQQMTRIQRKNYLELRRATVVLQRSIRAWLLLRARERNAEKIQALFRGYQARRRYRAILSATHTLQKYARSFLASSRLRQHYLQQRSACVVLQAAMRGWKVRQRVATLRRAATVIGAHYRGYKARQHYKALGHSAGVLQKRFRAGVVAQEQRKMFLSVKHAALLIQCHFRGSRVRQRIALEQEVRQKVAITIQKVFRGHLQRMRYLSQQEAATAIQSHWRATRSMRAEREAFLSFKRSTTVIQAWFRAQLAAREQAALIKQLSTFRESSVVTGSGGDLQLSEPLRWSFRPGEEQHSV